MCHHVKLFQLSMTVMMIKILNNQSLTRKLKLILKKNDKKKRGACKSEVQGEPCSSSGISFIDQGIATLTRLFPDEQIDSLREALVLYEDVEMAANAISRRQDISFPKRKTHEKEKQVESDVYEYLKQIRAKMKSFMSAEALKIADEEDIVFDFFRYYKSKEFDPEIPISVRYKGQPGVDSGGILRQAFTKVFKMIADNEVQGLRLFTGPSNRVTPIYSSAHILNNTFETVGKMAAHSLAQGGPGFPYLAPAVFWYLATGDLNEAVSRASCIDVVDPDLLSYLEKVKENSPISELSCDGVFICLLQECGEIRKITETNKFEIMQVLILHATVVKHKAALDQFRKGLEILGVLSEIEKAPNKYEHFFVHSEEEITADSVKNLLQMPDKLSNSVVESSVGMLNTFLEKASKEDLKSFLSFATGSQLITGALRPHCISVSVENSQGFFASTCTLELKIPADVLSYSHFELLLRSVMKGNKFTTV